MGTCAKVLFVTVLGLSIFIGIKINSLFEVPPLPKLENTWWGPGQPSKVDTSIKPFKINVPEKVLLDLTNRLKNARPFTPALEGVQQQYGINSKLLTEIIEFWATRYDWREREKFLNQYPQFKTNIQGLDIHFIHVKPTKTEGLKVLPLLLLHGWPGSVREFYEIIPKLTTPKKGNDFVFEVIVPSLPGFGFSQGTSKPGFSTHHMSIVFKNLMEKLGFKKYYLQGGDAGAVIAKYMATFYPDKILGVHSNMCFINSPAANFIHLLGSICPSFVVEKKYEHRLYPISTFLENILLEFGYLHIQATKPDTVGVALNDSPVGLAAYILEKFTTWTNAAWKEREDGGLKLKYSYVDLLDNVMIYWLTNSIMTSQRLYAENFSKATTALNLDSLPITVPSACVWFVNELAYIPETILTLQYKNLLHIGHYDDGGHFAAFEVPELLSDDIWTSIRKMEDFHKSSK